MSSLFSSLTRSPVFGRSSSSSLTLPPPMDPEHSSFLTLSHSHPPSLLSGLPVELFLDVSSYLDAPSLLSLTRVSFAFASEFHCSNDYWKLLYIERWGKEQQINVHTRISNSVQALVFHLKSGSNYFWNAIEFSFSQGYGYKAGNENQNQNQQQQQNQVNGNGNGNGIESNQQLQLQQQQNEHQLNTPSQSLILNHGDMDPNGESSSTVAGLIASKDEPTPPSLLECSQLTKSKSDASPSLSLHAMPQSASLSRSSSIPASLPARSLSSNRSSFSLLRSTSRSSSPQLPSHNLISLLRSAPKQWKIACLLRFGPSSLASEVDIRRCSLCNQLDLYSPSNSLADGSFTSRSALVPSLDYSSVWLQPCSCGTVIHRQCSERELLINKRAITELNAKPRRRTQGNDAADTSAQPDQAQSEAHSEAQPSQPEDRSSSPPASSASSFGRLQATHSILDSAPETSSLNLACPICHSPYQFTQRLPLSLYELLTATYRDRYWLLRNFLFLTIPFLILAWLFIFTLENIPYFLDWTPRPALFFDSDRPLNALRYPSHIVNAFLVYHHFLCCILFSARFHATVATIWPTPLFLFYVKLYLVMTLSVVAFVASVIAIPVPAPIYDTLATVAQFPGISLIAAFNVALFYLFSSIIIFLFWKTQYRVQTLKDASETGQNPDSPAIMRHVEPAPAISAMQTGQVHPAQPPPSPAVAPVASGSFSGLFSRHLLSRHQHSDHDYEDCLMCSLLLFTQGQRLINRNRERINIQRRRIGNQHHLHED